MASHVRRDPQQAHKSRFATAVTQNLRCSDPLTTLNKMMCRDSRVWKGAESDQSPAEGQVAPTPAQAGGEGRAQRRAESGR